MAIEAVCYVDFSGDLRTAICDAPIALDELERGRRVTLFMSSATCPGCIEKIQARLAALGQASSCDDSAFSSSART